MRAIERDGLHYLQFDSLPSDRVAHGIFTRRGGTSDPPWDSLNVGSTVGDDPARVAENRRRMFAALDRKVDSGFDLWQVHAARVIQVSSPRHGVPYPRADAAITDVPTVTLWMRFADCVPILIYDPDRPAVGIAHAGWKGTVLMVAKALVDEFRTAYASAPERLRAAIGPAIGQHHYPVGEDVIDALYGSWGRDGDRFLMWDADGAHLDLPAANAHLLRESGLEQIERADICTACELTDWYSHRAEDAQTGRFGAMIALTERTGGEGG